MNTPDPPVEEPGEHDPQPEPEDEDEHEEEKEAAQTLYPLENFRDAKA